MMVNKVRNDGAFVYYILCTEGPGNSGSIGNTSEIYKIPLQFNVKTRRKENKWR